MDKEIKHVEIVSRFDLTIKNPFIVTKDGCCAKIEISSARTREHDNKTRMAELESENKRLKMLLKESIEEWDDSCCTCGAEDDGFSECGCTYHDILEALG